MFLELHFRLLHIFRSRMLSVSTLRGSGVPRICCEEGQSWKLGHGAVMVNFRALPSSGLMTNSFVTSAVLIERVVSC